MININELRIDPASLGSTKFLTGVAPYFKYDEEKNRTNEVEGYRYDVALAEKGLEKISVKIAGEKQMDVPESGLEAVDFSGMDIHIYIIDGKPLITAKANKIYKAKSAN